MGAKKNKDVDKQSIDLRGRNYSICTELIWGRNLAVLFGAFYRLHL